jgi:hypothetical protein
MQACFARFVRTMTVLVVATIIVHTFAPEARPPFTRLGALDSVLFDLIGGADKLIAGTSLYALTR